jgi:hypothetical protein
VNSREATGEVDGMRVRNLVAMLAGIVLIALIAKE